ncbi:MAG: PTS sugar transporter subunit IIA [Luminiphilus sp.]
MSTPNHLAPERLLALRPETVHSKKRLFEQAAASISAEFDLDQESVYRSLLAREKLGSTAIGHGVAIPHSRMSGCSEPLGCLILLSEGVDFGAPDGADVEIAFILLVPEAATQDHLDLLASLANAFSNADIRDRLKKADSAGDARLVLLEGLGL